MEYKKVGILLLEELNPITKGIINILKNHYAVCIDETEEGIMVAILVELSTDSK